MTARGVPYASAIVFALCLTAAVGPGPDIDPAWLSVDAPAKTVRFQLIAGLTGVNGALNFNGFSDGGLTLVVPVGWRTEIDFRNHDGMLPHSAEIVAPQTPLPTQPVPPALTRASAAARPSSCTTTASASWRCVSSPAERSTCRCRSRGAWQARRSWHSGWG